MLKVWNAGLVMTTYLLCVFGTFLTRSGIVSSVHAFASSEFAWRFLVFIVVAVLLSAGLLITRLKDLRTENELEAVVSRESGFLLNNLLLLAACFAVLWGTLFPVLSEAVQGEQITVGAPFFNRVKRPARPRAPADDRGGAAARVAPVLGGQPAPELHRADPLRDRGGRTARALRDAPSLRHPLLRDGRLRVRHHRDRVPPRGPRPPRPPGRQLPERARGPRPAEHPPLRGLHRSPRGSCCSSSGSPGTPSTGT